MASRTAELHIRAMSNPVSRFLVAAGLVAFGGEAIAQARGSLSRLDTTSFVEIGYDGTPSTYFWFIKGAVSVSDGTIAIATIHGDIRMFDARGTYLRSFGKEGDGPGEFRSIFWAGQSGDTMFLHDPDLKRITTVVLGAHPRLVGTVTLTVANDDRGSIAIKGRLPDGRWLAQARPARSYAGAPEPFRESNSIGLIDANGGKVNWLERLDGQRILRHNPAGAPGERLVGPMAFTPDAYSAVSGSNVWMGDSSGDSLIVVNAAGRRSTVRLLIPRRQLTGAMIDTSRERTLANTQSPLGGAAIRAWHTPSLLPRDLPFFNRVLPTPSGDVWVEQYSIFREPVRYLVVAPSGATRAFVAVPRGVRLVHIGVNHAIGIHEEDDGSQTIRVYSFVP